MKIIRQFLLTKVLCCIAFVFLGAATASAEPVHLVLNWKAEPQFGGFLAAQQNGIFKKNNLEVVVQQGGSGTPTLQMLAAGQTEFGVISADELLIAASRGNHSIVAIFAAFQKNPQGIMVRKDQNIGSLAQLFSSDLTLLWQEGLPYAKYLKNKYKSVFKIHTAPYQGGLAAFLSRKDLAQQCFVSSEPLISAKQGVATTVFLAADEGYNPYTTVLAVSRSYLDAHSTEVERVVRSVREGWEHYLNAPLDTHKLITQMNPAMTEAEMTAIDQAQKNLIQPSSQQMIGQMTSERWSELAKSLFVNGVTKELVNPSGLFLNP